MGVLAFILLLMLEMKHRWMTALAWGVLESLPTSWVEWLIR